LLLRYREILSFLFVIFAPDVVRILGLPAMIVPCFRIAILGAFLHCLVLITVIIMLYFDFQAEVLGLCGLFVVANGGLSFLTMQMGVGAMGYGYFLSAFLTLAAAIYLIDRKLRHLQYYTFAVQPLGVHREEGLG
jgi:polysaccharide biosynthesis protein PelG